MGNASNLGRCLQGPSQVGTSNSRRRLRRAHVLSAWPETGIQCSPIFVGICGLPLGNWFAKSKREGNGGPGFSIKGGSGDGRAQGTQRSLAVHSQRVAQHRVQAPRTFAFPLNQADHVVQRTKLPRQNCAQKHGSKVLRAK
eukprot:2776408-Amphidinium_carterae.1